MNLLDLFQKSSARPELQREVDGEFWKVIEESGIRRWRKGDPIVGEGRRMLIGLASYSRQDVELAQRVIDRQLGHLRAPAIELFNVLDVHEMRDFEHYIPGIDAVYQTPLVGLWEEGVLLRTAQGFSALELIDELISKSNGI